MAVEEAWGTIAADGDEVSIDVTGYGGGLVSIVGTFEGTLEMIGQVDEDAAEGGRMVFVSNTGSTGNNLIYGTGGAVSKEIRFIPGGAIFKVRGKDWVSGSVEVKIHITDQPFMTFVNGPTLTADQQFTRAKKSFTGGLVPSEASASDVAHLVIENPSSSGVNVLLTKRLFGNDNSDSEDHIIYQAYVNPTVDKSSWDTVNAANLYVGGPASNAIIHTFVGTAATMGGTQASGEILPNGAPYVREILAILEPGVSLGYTIQGDGGGGNASSVSMILEFYEEAII